MHIVRTLLVAAATAVVARAASAQKMGTIELGVFAHYTTVNNDAQLGDHSTGFGGRGGIFLFRQFEAEIEYGRGTVQTGGIRYTDNAWFPMRILGTANVPLGSRTKLLIGAGIVDTYKGDITNNEFEEGWSLLGGLRVCFGDAWSVRPEAVFDKLPSPSWMQRNYLFRPAGNPTSTRVQFRIGLSRFIGRGQSSCRKESHHEAPPAPPAARAAVMSAPAPLPPTATLSASPTRITAGESSTLSWSSANASACSSSWTSSTASSGTQSVSPVTNTTYTVSCSGAGGTTNASVTIGVAQPAPPPTPTPPPARPTPTPVPAPVRAPPKEFFTLSGVHFDFDKSTIRPGGKLRLDSAVVILNQYPDARIEIQGHTDSVGTVAYNIGLSERRANAVRDYLVSKGISAGRLTTHGYGKSQPVASNDTKEGRQLNRRVVLIEMRD